MIEAIILTVLTFAAIGLATVIWLAVHVPGWLREIREQERQEAIARARKKYDIARDWVVPDSHEAVAAVRDYMADIDHINEVFPS